MPQGTQISQVGAPAQRHDEIGLAAPNGGSVRDLHPYLGRSE
jgi:hypothetical protein